MESLLCKRDVPLNLTPARWIRKSYVRNSKFTNSISLEMQFFELHIYSIPYVGSWESRKTKEATM